MYYGGIGYLTFIIYQQDPQYNGYENKDYPVPSDPHIMFSIMQTESIRIEIDPGDVLHWRKTNKK